ncbi:MAG TPA: cytochrome c [Candidatus Acidoferrum sp.]|nr:cytochrome c [Candidatus Acidoferrum sp.]
MRNTREASTLEETVAKTRTSLNKLLLGMGAIGVIFLLGLPARAQETTETLFKGKCGMCHGPDGAGKTMMGEKLKIPDLQSADVQKKSDADLKTIIIKGKNKMPGYETKLSKEQVDKLVAHLRDLAKKH